MKTIRITIAVLIAAVLVPAAGWSQDAKISKKTEQTQQKKERKEQKNLQQIKRLEARSVASKADKELTGSQKRALKKQARVDELKRLVLIGDGMAQLELGYHFFYGIGVPRDRYRAASLFRLAAHQDIPIAIANYAQCLYHGIGVKMDRSQGILLGLRWETLKTGMSRTDYNPDPSYAWWINIYDFIVDKQFEWSTH